MLDRSIWTGGNRSPFPMQFTTCKGSFALLLVSNRNPGLRLQWTRQSRKWTIRYALSNSIISEVQAVLQHYLPEI